MQDDNNAENTTTDQARRRGVRASTAKIRQAMRQAGIYSQAELAKKIQDTEQSPSLPRSLVSRVCRGEAVDPVSIERVAAVMDLQGWELYLSSSEPQSQSIDDTIDDTISDKSTLAPQIQQASKNTWLWGAGVLCLFIFLLWFIIPLSKPEQPQNTASPITPLSIVLLAKNTNSLDFAQHLATQLQPHHHVSVVSSSQNDASRHVIETAKQYEADAVITVKSKQSGRYISQQVRLYIKGTERVISYHVFPLANHKMYQQLYAPSVYKAVLDIAEQPLTQLYIDDNYMRTMDVFLDVQQLLDKREIQKYGDKITSKILGLLTEDEQNAYLQSSLCHAYILKSWQEDEKHFLTLAENACERAKKQGSPSPYTQSVNAHLLTATGQTELALQTFESILAKWPNHILSLAGYAEANLQYANQHPNKASQSYKDATDSLLLGIELEPDYWYLHELKGSIHFAIQETKQSLDEFETAAALSGNTVSLTNVGVLSLCQGFDEKAENIFMQVQKLAPHSHLGDQFLGLLWSYQGRYESAIHSILIALKKLGDTQGANIYDYWGYLGDTYRWSGAVQESNHAYQQALKTLHHYRLLGVDGTAEEIAELYYETMISKQTNTQSNNQQKRQALLKKFIEYEGGMADTLKLAQLELAFGDTHKGKERWLKLVNNCNFYRMNPDFSAPSKDLL